jgi:hypothetical protein
MLPADRVYFSSEHVRALLFKRVLCCHYIRSIRHNTWYVTLSLHSLWALSATSDVLSHGFTTEGSNLLRYDTLQKYQHLGQFPASTFRVIQQELSAIRTAGNKLVWNVAIHVLIYTASCPGTFVFTLIMLHLLQGWILFDTSENNSGVGKLMLTQLKCKS